ncbi:MAG: hypothetical protein J7599_15890 [Niabella sp.]|nr:hypothetical protein [Niabella sp.]
MHKLLLILFAVFAFSFQGCKKGDLDFNNSDAAHPKIPVTVSDVYMYYNGVPSVSTSVAAGGNITIQLNIPSSSGRTIKEITRVAFANTTSNYAIIQNPNPAYSSPAPPLTGPYSATSVAGSGTSVTFTTSLADYATRTKSTLVTAGGTATSFLGRYLYFLVTLDDGSTLIPVPVRVYVDN